MEEIFQVFKRDQPVVQSSIVVPMDDDKFKNICPQEIKNKT
jgi:hypothetical protein